MTLVSVEGPLRRVSRTLMKCCECGCFHIIPSLGAPDDNSGVQQYKHLKDKNLYAPIIKRAQTFADTLKIKLVYADYSNVEQNVHVDFDAYLKEKEAKLDALIDRRETARKELENYAQAEQQVDLVSGLDADFQKVFAMKYIKVRFGRIPEDSLSKLRYYEDKKIIFIRYETQKIDRRTDYVWGVYFTPRDGSEEIDEIFRSLYFERVRMPDFLSGTAEDAKKQISGLIEQEQNNLKSAEADIEAFRAEIQSEFLAVCCKLQAINESVELRSFAAVINNRFYLSGYVPKREVQTFTEQMAEVEGVSAVTMPPAKMESDYAYYIPPPVKLRNNRFIRPFEMFINMYGLPTYGGIDPTPFVAISYMLIYGIMFADVGQGLFISLLGLILTWRTKAGLAPIISRIGLASAFFGVLNGSVFGSEEIITPFFKYESVYGLMGLTDVPHRIFEVAALLLIGTLGLGFVLILVSMLMNILSSLKLRDYSSGLLGASGIAGFTLYSAIVIGAAWTLASGENAFTLPYVLGLIVLPILLIFFKEPLAKLAKRFDARVHREGIGNDSVLLASIEANNLQNENGKRVLRELMRCKYVVTQYGSLPLERYEKLGFIKGRRFFFIPFESDGFRVMGVYLATQTDFPGVDRIMSLLGFTKEKLPWQGSNAQNAQTAQTEDEALDAKADMMSRYAGNIGKKPGEFAKPSEGKSNAAAEGKKSGGKRKQRGANGKEKFSIGGFFFENFLEMFESALSYLSNTMSFMRVGGYILSHAGLMLVVQLIAGMAGPELSVGWFAVTIFGNLFVIVVEGFLVGIQALRLEFYEMFSRFYRSDGVAFKPVHLDFKEK
jgi:V/A-type H+-transporting ATPase subunit I